MITIDQNVDKQILRLAAQRQLYATAKVVFGWQVFLAGPIAVLGAVLVIFQPSLKVHVAAWGILVSLCDVFWLASWQKSLRSSAAKIQELFDCDVLQLRWNDLKVGKRPDPELIKEQSLKYKKWAHKMTALQNWYSVAVDELPLHIARIICQRTNCWWDGKQRRAYSYLIIGTVSCVFLILLALAMIGGISVEEFILKVIAPFAPALLLGIRQFSEQRDAANRLDQLKYHCESIWNSALSGKSKTALILMSRNLQDEIFDNRRKTLPVLDFIFKRLRNSFEVQMNYASEHYVQEAKKALDEKKHQNGRRH
jgi:hypothetical protein